MLFAIGMSLSALASAIVLTWLLRRIPATRSVARFVGLYLRAIFVAYSVMWALLAAGVNL